MRQDQYRQLLHMNRRAMMTGAAAAVLASSAGRISPAFADAGSDLRAQLARVPGIGNGAPGDAEWQKVGELCLGPTKANVQPGEFTGVELRFMGLNTVGDFNVVWRGMLKSWEEYTGAKIAWIDVATPELTTRLQQGMALGSFDFDITQSGPAYEGDLGSRGLLSEVPDWVAKQIDMDDYVNYLKPPVGTWGGKTYRLSVDGDTHTFNYRTDVFSDPDLAKQWGAVADKAGLATWGVPKTWQQVQATTKFLKGKKVAGKDVYGYLDACKPWGGYDFYFLGSRATAYAKYPGVPEFLFDLDTMKPRINNPAWVRAIQDVVDAIPFEPADQLSQDGLSIAFTQFMGGVGSMVSWWGDIGQNVKTSDSSAIGDVTSFSILPGSEDVYNAKTGQWEKLAAGPNYAPNLAFLGYGLYVMKGVEANAKKHKAAWSAVAHLAGKDISLWTQLYPTGCQPYRNSHFNVAEWVAAGYDESFIAPLLNSWRDSYNHPNAAIEPRIPGLFQYYSAADDELAKVWAGQRTAQQGADAVAAAWDRITDQLGRDKQIKLYKQALGKA